MTKNATDHKAEDSPSIKRQKLKEAAEEIDLDEELSEGTQFELDLDDLPEDPFELLSMAREERADLEKIMDQNDFESSESESESQAESEMEFENEDRFAIVTQLYELAVDRLEQSVESAKDAEEKEKSQLALFDAQLELADLNCVPELMREVVEKIKEALMSKEVLNAGHYHSRLAHAYLYLLEQCIQQYDDEEEEEEALEQDENVDEEDDDIVLKWNEKARSCWKDFIDHLQSMEETMEEEHYHSLISRLLPKLPLKEDVSGCMRELIEILRPKLNEKVVSVYESVLLLDRNHETIEKDLVAFLETPQPSHKSLLTQGMLRRMKLVMLAEPDEAESHVVSAMCIARQGLRAWPEDEEFKELLGALTREE